MTLPTLMANYQKKVSATRAKQAYSMLAQAIKLSEAQNGDAKYWNQSLVEDASSSTQQGVKNTELFLQKYILPYLNGAKLCGEGSSDDVTSKCGPSASQAGQSYLLPNGTSISFVPAASRFYVSNDFILAIIVDINAGKQPNTLGNDAFYFWLTPNNGLLPYPGIKNLSREDILQGVNVPSVDDDSGNTILVSCKKNASDDGDSYYRYGCTYLLMIDGWEIKDDYPW